MLHIPPRFSARLCRRLLIPSRPKAPNIIHHSSDIRPQTSYNIQHTSYNIHHTYTQGTNNGHAAVPNNAEVALVPQDIKAMRGGYNLRLPELNQPRQQALHEAHHTASHLPTPRIPQRQSEFAFRKNNFDLNKNNFDFCFTRLFSKVDKKDILAKNSCLSDWPADCKQTSGP